MPWIGLEINNNGEMRPCCAWRADAVRDEQGQKFNINTHTIDQYHNSKELNDVRRRLLAGEKIEQCRKCYHEESVGVRSMRVRKNAIFPADVRKDGLLKSIDIKLSNLCNQKCMICNATASSMVATENKTLFPEVMKRFRYDDFNWYKLDERWEELKQIAHTAQHFDFYGGEPWLIKKQWEFIRYLVENDLARHISINYATNGSVFEERWFEEYFPKFKSVTILFSADGTGPTFEYARYPAEWATFARSIREITKYRDSGVVNWIGIAYTVSAFSIHNVIDSLEFYKELDIPVWFNLVNEEEFRASLLPEEVKTTIKQDIHSRWQDAFVLSDKLGPEFFDAELDRTVEQRWIDLFVTKTNARDSYRGVSFGDVLPAVKDWMNAK